MRALSLLTAAGLLGGLAACERWAAQNPVEGMATLEGAHATAPCEACHDVNEPFTAAVLTCDGVVVLPGSGTFTGTSSSTPTGAPLDWQAQCLACHECNRPQPGDTVCGEVITLPHKGVGSSCGTADCHSFSHDAWNGLVGGERLCDGGGGELCAACHDRENGGTHDPANGAPLSPSHTAHLDTTLDTVPDGAGGYEAYSCDTCHPDGGADAATHGGAGNGTVDVLLESGGTTFGTWDPAAATCAVVCHGDGPTPTLTYSARVTLVPGDVLTAPDTPLLPVWDTDLGGGCDSCHGSPPVQGAGDDYVIAFHADPIPSCAGCHGATGGADPALVTDGGPHLDGTFVCNHPECP